MSMTNDERTANDATSLVGPRDEPTVAPLPADHPWAGGGDVEVLLAVWEAWGVRQPRLAATVAVAIPAREGGIVRAEAFPDFNAAGLRLLEVVGYVEPDVDTPEALRR